MDLKEFEISLEQGHLRSKKILTKKADEYARYGTDRLVQFRKLAIITNSNKAEACVSLMSKHFSSVCDMAHRPNEFTLKQWREKITDLRNYTHLLDALVEEMLEE